MKNFKHILFTTLAIAAFSCTDLEVEEIDSEVIEEDLSEVNVESNLTDLYNSFGNALLNQEQTYGLMEITADAQLIPTRGTDWGDGGKWRQLHQHTWNANNQDVLNSWEALNSLTFKANQVLLSGPDAQEEAETRFIRALASFLILDLWGLVPDRDPSASVLSDPEILTREEAVARISEDLSDEHISNLPSTGPRDVSSLRVASQASALFLRAKFHLNKHILLNGGNSGASPENADMQQVIADVDAITGEGFSIQEDYFAIFEEPTESTESIYLITGNDGSNFRIANTLHYNHNYIFNGGGWNGFATTSEFYSLFEGPEDNNEPGSGQEERRGYVPTTGDRSSIFGRGMLFGQQYGVEIDDDGESVLNEAGEEIVIPLETRGGSPLFFTREMPEDIIGHNEATGIRLIKYPPRLNDEGRAGVGPSFQIFMRYADALLMKAEAQYRSGNSGEALVLINELREEREATPLASLSEDDIIDERGRELYIEFWRRQDLIRFGKFLDPWLYKPRSDEFRLLFPIPITAVSTNPNLEQNPGY